MTTFKDGSPEETGKPQQPPDRRIVALYNYEGETGKLVYQVVRFLPKDFRQRRPDPEKPGQWIWNLDQTKKVLYHLPEVRRACKSGQLVVIVEGEKDVETLRSAGFVATCNPGGAGKWSDDFSESLRGVDVAIIPDSDSPGEDHAELVAGKLHGIAKSIRIVALPITDGQPVKDVTDFLSEGGTREELLKLISETPIKSLPEENLASRSESEASSALEEKYGQPFYLNKDGAISSINQAFWAALYAEENVVLYEPDEQAFYRYNPSTGIYEVESADAIKTAISSRLLEASRQADAFALQKFRTSAGLDSIVSHLRGLVEKRGAFTERRKTIHLANGVVDFSSGKAQLLPFSPEYRARNRSPIPFDPNAKCERFLNELVIPAVHPEEVELLQKFAGMLLLGDNRAQRVVILDGEGGRGKTQFANVLRDIIGTANVTQLRTEQLGGRFEIFRFLKKSLLVGLDVKPDFLSTKGASVIKALVGGDWFDAEQKGGTGSFQVQGNFNILITSNSRLRVRLEGDISAWKRRLVIIRFQGPPPVLKIADFARYLIEKEGPGILNWALLGAKKLLEEIPDSGGNLVLTPRQCGIVDSLLAESESLRHFLKDKLEKTSLSDVTRSELIEAYAAYCPDKKWQALPITEVQSQLDALVLDLFGTTQRHNIQRDGKNCRGYGGIGFKAGSGG